MYLRVIKIKIKIYIFYTIYGATVNGHLIPLSHLKELKSECSKHSHPTGTMAFMCTEENIPEKPFDFFFLQVALSLEDHSFEVQVVKHLLHVLPHPMIILTSSCYDWSGMVKVTKALMAKWNKYFSVLIFQFWSDLQGRGQQIIARATIFVNNVLLEYSHILLFTFQPQVARLSVVKTKTVWSEKLELSGSVRKFASPWLSH